ncbi:SDR family NAD(P)-dependent oxidoreductase [Leptolyngbya sp. 7M]|uniref:SDR family NAD(P)-dependent oxidoreductase n=1 Tax=Leptolyngbya sp. 7M TaxID=2812896 RepID=UPI001B8B234E|nr:SDR family NAD(P)-dependent oxidoreductase [Leptolyngbya sp. 7M]QYO61992.1 SDR family NAD(P)-dependent oxidoreductase [Leptolyngbya sp. 7M]
MSQSTQQLQPKQHQEQRPGIEAEMSPQPKSQDEQYKGSDKLRNKVALITGGDSGIGRAVAIAYAKEGADVAIVYLNEHEDAKQTQRLVEQEGRKCIAIAGDIGDESFCQQAVQKTVQDLGNAAGSKFCSDCGEKMEITQVPCVKCGAKLREGAKFCSECGTSQEKQKCSNAECGAELSAGSKFCPECGTKTADAD